MRIISFKWWRRPSFVRFSLSDLLWFSVAIPVGTGFIAGVEYLAHTALDWTFRSAGAGDWQLTFTDWLFGKSQFWQQFLSLPLHLPGWLVLSLLICIASALISRQKLLYFLFLSLICLEFTWLLELYNLTGSVTLAYCPADLLTRAIAVLLFSASAAFGRCISLCLRQKSVARQVSIGTFGTVVFGLVVLAVSGIGWWYLNSLKDFSVTIPTF